MATGLRIDSSTPDVKSSKRDGKQDQSRYKHARLAIANMSSLEADFSALRADESCFACGATLAVVESVTYKFRYECNPSTHITVEKELPGYRCPDCGTEFLDHTTDRKFLKGVASVIDELSDDHEFAQALGAEEKKRQPTGTFSPIPFALLKNS